MYTFKIYDVKILKIFEGSDLLTGKSRARAREALETGDAEELVKLLPRVQLLALGQRRATWLAKDLLGVII